MEDEKASVKPGVKQASNSVLLLKIWKNRFQGFAGLAAIAALGYCLAALGNLKNPDPLVFSLGSEEGEMMILVIERQPGGRSSYPPDFRMILSKLPITLDAARQVIQLPGGGQRLAPSDWELALVPGEGQIESQHLRLSPTQLHHLLLQARKGSYTGAKNTLLTFDPGLKSFYQSL